MKTHFINIKDELRLRGTPLPHDEAEREFTESRALILEKTATFEFPQKYAKFRGT